MGMKRNVHGLLVRGDAPNTRKCARRKSDACYMMFLLVSMNRTNGRHAYETGFLITPPAPVSSLTASNGLFGDWRCNIIVTSCKKMAETAPRDPINRSIVRDECEEFMDFRRREPHVSARLSSKY